MNNKGRGPALGVEVPECEVLLPRDTSPEQVNSGSQVNIESDSGHRPEAHASGWGKVPRGAWICALGAYARATVSATGCGMDREPSRQSPYTSPGSVTGPIAPRLGEIPVGGALTPGLPPSAAYRSCFACRSPVQW